MGQQMLRVKRKRFFFFFCCCSSPTTPRIRASSAESTWNLWPGVIEHRKRDYPSDKYLVGRWIRSMDRYCVSPRLVNSVFFIFVKVKFLQGFFLQGGKIPNDDMFCSILYGVIKNLFLFFFLYQKIKNKELYNPCMYVLDEKIYKD